MALNYIDNLDARLEMFAAGYLVAKPIAERDFRSGPAVAGKSGQAAREIHDCRTIRLTRLRRCRAALSVASSGYSYGSISERFDEIFSSISKPMNFAAALAARGISDAREMDRASSALSSRRAA